MHVAGRAQTVRRTHEWQRLLAEHYTGWAPLMERIEEPVGRAFSADLGAGEQLFELTRDADGYVAIPSEGVTPRRLNVTEAEFARLDLLRVLRRVQAAAGCEGVVEPLRANAYSLGRRTIAGKVVALLAAPHGIERMTAEDRIRLAVRAAGVDVQLLLAPDLLVAAASGLEQLAGLGLAVSDLPPSPPWTIDWSPLVLDERFEVPMTDAVLFFGSRYAIIVDAGQQRIWLENRELKVKADGHSYRLFAHLAGAQGAAVPVKVLANHVLEADGVRTESKIVSEVKLELKRAIETCLTPAPAGARIDATELITIEGGRARLNVDPSLVKVIRRVSGH